MTDSNDPRRAAEDEAERGSREPVTGARRPRGKRKRRAAPVPVAADMLEGAPHFAPVPRATCRYDGWTYPRQRAFIKALAETGSVARACLAVGMATVGVYLLRKADGAGEFAAAWDEAQALGVQRLHDIALERAIYGVPRPIFYKGEQVGEERRYNDRLLNAVLRHHDPEGWGASQQRSRVPPHVRRALYEEWEREWYARQERDEVSAKERLRIKLEEMRERLDAAEGEG
ncbi:hypothetical protein [Sphingomonas sp.]|uniref:hypothetical protein n=1 Tax=Sphingomonas sp. TaxID=28214 RepID=UPI003B002C13